MPHLSRFISGLCRRSAVRSILLFAGSVLAAAGAYAQVGANLSGTVRDTTGAVIAGASVTVTNLATGESRVLTSGSQGEYRAVNLPPAQYSVTAQAVGFGTTKKTVELLVGSELTSDIDLGTAGTSEVVSVEAGGADVLIETTKSQPSSIIDNRQLAALPVLNRSFLAIAQTMPGVAPVAAMSVTQKFAVSKFGGVADQRNGFTTIIDGTPLDDSTWGAPIINISQDAIQEFKVFQHQFDAQYGKAMNAVVNVVTLAGGDKYHGTGYYFGRDASVNAINALATSMPQYKLLRTGATTGGPVPKIDRTHFFGSFEYVRINTAQVTALPSSNPYASQLNGNYPYTQWESIADVKVDHTFSDKHTAYGRYAYDHQFLPNGGPQNSASNTTDNSIAHSLVLEDNYILSPRMVNTARYAYLNHNLFSTPGNNNLNIVRPGYTFGQNNTLPQYFPRTNHTISDTLFISNAKHQLKLGAELTKVYSTYESHYYETGQFTFTTEAAFDPNNSATWPTVFTMQTPGEYFYRQLQYTGFAQDDYKVLPRLTLNLGLRYDFNSNLRNNKFYNSLLANPFFAGANNFISSSRGTDWVGGLQPRIGFAYDVDGRGKLVIRGGFGIYYTRMRPYWALQDQTQTLGAAVRITNPQQLKNYPNITAVLGGQSLQDYVNSGGARAANTLANDFSLPSSMNFSAGIGWQIDSRSSLNLNFVHDHSTKEIGTRDLNLPSSGVITQLAGAVPTGGVVSRPVPRFTTFGSVYNNGQSRYDALELQYRTRPKFLDTAVISYTYSRSMIDAVTYYSQYVGTMRTPQNYSYNPTDTPNNLSVSLASKEFLKGFRVSTIFRGLSGSPFSTQAGIDLDGDGIPNNDRPMGLPQYVGRGDVTSQLALINAFRAAPCRYLYYATTSCTIAAYGGGTINRNQLVPDATLTWDARITKAFHFGDRYLVEGFFEGYNLGNHPTRYAPNANMNSTAFMQPTAALPARQLQWGARVRY